MQYEWQAAEHQLINAALVVHQIGCTPELDYFNAHLSSDSDADMTFRLTSYEQ